jgi:CheY-like chemotaxis protein
LDVCRELLSDLPSKPEVLTANSGTRALALLESEPFSLLLTDLRMPNMDGFQVLAIVRRRFPSLRIVVMTGAVDEQFRARAYAMGIDLYVEKPKSQAETQFFFHCIESMLKPEELQGGFRGVQHKQLVDLIQMECLTQSSSVLKVTSGKASGRIWLLKGEIIDAATGDMTAERAFKEILSWKVGSFEMLPPEPKHPRTIKTSSQGLLLDSAQWIDETAAETEVDPQTGEPLSALARIGRTNGVEFLLAKGPKGKLDHWSCENAEELADWAEETLANFRALGEKLKSSVPTQVEGFGPQRHVVISSEKDSLRVAGFNRVLTPDQVRNSFKQVQSKWVS